GIVSMWRGESNTADSMDGNSGTAVGGLSYLSGKVGNAFSLNGTNGYVSVPDSPSLDSFTNRMTVELWLKGQTLTANPLWAWIVTKGNSSWRMIGTQGAKTVAFYASGTTNGVSMPSTRDVNDGQWHHVAGTYDGQYISLYVD